MFGFRKKQKKVVKDKVIKKIIEDFDESAYLEANPDVKTGILNGQFKDALHHLKIFGFNEIEQGVRAFYKDLEPYNEEKYLNAFSDIKIEIEKGNFSSGFEHFSKKGYKEILNGIRSWNKIEKMTISHFDEVSFLYANEDVNGMISNGVYSNLHHYLKTDGFAEMQKGIRPFHKDFKPFNELIYIEQNSDIMDEIKNGKFKLGYDHFSKQGYLEIINNSRFWERYSRNKYPIKNNCKKLEAKNKSNILKEKRNIPIKGFDEDEYLKVNLFVAKAIDGGEYTNLAEHLEIIGLEQIENGLRKFHSRYQAFDETRYLQLYSDVREELDKTDISSGFEHFCRIGYYEIINELRIWK